MDANMMNYLSTYIKFCIMQNLWFSLDITITLPQHAGLYYPLSCRPGNIGDWVY